MSTHLLLLLSMIATCKGQMPSGLSGPLTSMAQEMETASAGHDNQAVISKLMAQAKAEVARKLEAQGNAGAFGSSVDKTVNSGRNALFSVDSSAAQNLASKIGELKRAVSQRGPDAVQQLVNELIYKKKSFLEKNDKEFNVFLKDSVLPTMNQVNMKLIHEISTLQTKQVNLLAEMFQH